MTTLDLSKLIREGKETLAKSRKRRVEKTKNNILQVKERLSKEADLVLMKSSFKKFIQSTVVQQTCTECGNETSYAGDSYVINEDKHGNHYIGQRLNNRMLFDLNLTDTDVQIVYTNLTTPRCHNCLFILEQRTELRHLVDEANVA